MDSWKDAVSELDKFTSDDGCCMGSVTPLPINFDIIINLTKNCDMVATVSSWKSVKLNNLLSL